MKHPRTIKLLSLMADYDVDPASVATMLGRSTKTIYCWRAQSPAPIPPQMLELLELKLQNERRIGE